VIHYPIIIIGAGPAGLCSAISAGRALGNKKGKILVLEGNTEAGKKLLLSGNGQCNFTNSLPMEDFIKSMGKFGMYLKPAYYAFNSHNLADLLAEAGCENFVREDGKIFPKSMKAEDVRTAMLEQLWHSGAELKTGSRVLAVQKGADDGFILKLESGETLGCDKLILATGGASYPKTGSDGKALKLAKSLGHSIIPFRPHLNGVELEDFDNYKGCSGITVPYAQATFITQNGTFKAVGDLLVTHKGFSGPLIMDNCHRLQSGDTISMCWVPHADALIPELKKQYNSQNLINALWIVPVPHNLLLAILKYNYMWRYQKMYELRKKEMNALTTYLMDCRYIIKKTGSLATAMASAGGIPLAEINAKTMQSRVCPGLFFAGEIMDYALPTGGFNIQMACSTGWMAGKAAAL